MIRRPPRSTLFPTRRSSDLFKFTVVGDRRIRFGLGAIKNVGGGAIESIIAGRRAGGPYRSLVDRSEEHTSELQSQSNLVCRLLLEKKKAMSASGEGSL